MSDLLDAFALGVRAMFTYQAIFFALLAIGLNVHFGYTGLLNFGQIAFAMLGGFGLAISVAKWGLPFWVGVLVGSARRGRAGPAARPADPAAAGGLPRDRHHRGGGGATAVVPVGVGDAHHQQHAGDLRVQRRLPGAGPRGARAVATTSSARAGTAASCGSITVGWSLVILTSLLVWALMRSPWGRVLRAVREDEDAARALGKNVYSYKMQSLVLGGLFGALGGMVYAVGTGSAQPDQYQNANTFLAYGALILGGAATIAGPIIGVDAPAGSSSPSPTAPSRHCCPTTGRSSASSRSTRCSPRPMLPTRASSSSASGSCFS